MPNHINKQLSYSEIVKIVERLNEESKVQPDYAENDPNKKSHILNRLCYETGEPAKVYTPTSYNISTTKFLVNAGLATNEIINEEDLSKYSITVELWSNKKGAEAPQTVEYNLSQMKATNTYSNGVLVGCRYTKNVGRREFYDARIYVIYNYAAYNAASVPEDTNYVDQKTKFTSNGVYVCKGEYDTWEGVAPIYTNYTTVKSLNKIATLKIHRLPNKFISLLTHKDFKALKETVEGISFDTLPDKPFSENYLITETITNRPLEDGHGVSFDGEGSGNWEAYQVSRSTYTKEQLLGGKCYISNLDYFIIDESHIVENTDDGLTVLEKYGGGTMNYYIWVAYTKNYQPEGFDSPLPAIGLYFSVLKSDYESLVIQQLDLEYIGIKKLDNMFLDLPKNEDFKTLKKRVEEGGLGDPVRTTGTGVAYEAEVPGITELKQGISFLMKPHVENTTKNTTLNVNGLGAKPITRPCSDDSTLIAMPIGFFATGKSYRVVYDGIYWVLADFTIPAVSDSIGRLPVGQGGVPETDESNAGKVLTTNDKGIPQWQTPSNAGATVDKIRAMHLASGNNRVYSAGDDGITWKNDEVEYELELGEGSTDYHYTGEVTFRAPIVAGENVSFEVDKESQVVKVNATGGTSNIVVPAKGARGQANFVESIPGLLKLYNESCGLGIDNYGQVGVVAATNQDIDAGTSMRKPIVPATFAYALSIFGLHFRIAIVEKNDTFAIKPGMIAVVHPWDKASFYTPDGTAILTNAGMSFIFSSEPVDSSDNYNANGDKYWMSVASISGFSSTSKHNSYSTSSGYCYFKNAHSDSSGSGRAYIYYIG